MKQAAPTSPQKSVGPLSPGTVLWARLRLKEVLPFSGDSTLWLATDLLTDSDHAVEMIAIGKRQRPAAWLENAAAYIPPAHGSLLPFYRIEQNSEWIAVISGDDARLRSLALNARTAIPNEPLRLLNWIEELAHAIDELHSSQLRPHGAIVPSRLSSIWDKAPLLSGYPHGISKLSPGDESFLSPGRKTGAEPTRADDVFSLSVLMYFLLSGGTLPTPATKRDRSSTTIDGLRQSRGLSPTGWPQGWDAGIFQALDDSSERRPENVRNWFNEINRALARPLLRPTLAHRDARRAISGVRSRSAPGWRTQRQRRVDSAQDTAANDVSSEGAPPELREQLEELSRQNQELLERNAELERKSAELEKEQATQQHDRAALDRLREKLQSEQEASASTVAQIERDHRALELAEAEQEKRAAQLDAWQKQLSEFDGVLAQICGSSSPSQWRGYVQQLAASKAENERRAAALAQERKRLDEIRLQLDARLADAAYAQLKAVDPVAASPAPAAAEAANDRAPESVLPVFSTDLSGTENAAPPPEKTATGHEIPFPALRPTPPQSEIASSGSVAPGDPIRKATILTPSGRHLHLFTGSTLRFGRHANSDVLLVAILTGQAQPTLALNREISRKHFELQITKDGIQVIDGWSDDGKASQHGLCVDGRRVQAGGAPLKNGMLLSVTTRAPARSVPYWKVHVFHRGATGDAAADDLPVAALWLQRLDDAPDDVAVILDSVPLQSLGVPESPADVVIASEAESLQWQIGTERLPLAKGASPLPNISVLSTGWSTPTIVVPNN